MQTVAKNNIRFVGLAAMTLLGIGGPGGSSVLADGGLVRVTQRSGDYRVTVFTAPNPMRAGPIDVSLLVQDVHTGTPITDVGILVTLGPPGESSAPIHAVATTSAATNKILQSAKIDLPTPGRWNVSVQCRPSGQLLEPKRGNTIRFAMQVAPPLPRWLTLWPWFTWPIIAILLFAVHRQLSVAGYNRRERQPATQPNRNNAADVQEDERTSLVPSCNMR